ncbi:Bacteriophage head to tail connecting protein [Cribrihabitans marinus]|uniref:Bacteriophage head to tail connecting protein n=1 Tax=Cribrihabitans marinus TaxID=1227549 RepID=A0A1H7CPG9_9RHOB|nr:portal protein [Cribrihabitans marinus]GGH36273.1 phage head-tail connector protein [Cribrihabitans marinus]SEJ91491.1 Bacteriophage head to tail connecting protein [Cribrihabitans marinus]
MKPDAITEKDPRAQEAIRRWDELKIERNQFDQDWSDIARLIRPQRGGFGIDSPTLRQLEKPLSSEPVIAHGNFAAGIYAGITNPANRWAGLETPDQELNNWQPMAEWNDQVTRIVMNSFSPSMSSFYPASYQAYADISAFGNAAGYDQVDPDRRGFIDVTISLAEVVVDIDFHGRVVEAVRKFHLTPRAAVREFGRDNVPPKVAELAEKGETEKHAWFHHVLRNESFQAGKLGPKGKRWLSHHVCELGDTLVRVKGYDEMPFYYPRWDVDSGFTYGTGPGYIALPSARVNQRMTDATIRAAQYAADPTKLAPDRNTVPLNGTFRPGAVVYGGVNMRGDPLIRNMDGVGNIGLTVEHQRATVEAIKEAFYYSVMSLTGRTGISDDENRIIEEARLRNWAPHADRIMEEYAARKVERRFRMLWRAGQIPPPPEGVPEGTPLQVRYQSAATMALRASEGQAIRGFLRDIVPLAQVKPRYMDRINDDALIEALHDASPSVPASILHSREVADQAAEARAQQAQAAQMMEAAQAGGGVVKDLAQAAAAGQGQGGGQ